MTDDTERPGIDEKQIDEKQSVMKPSGERPWQRWSLPTQVFRRRNGRWRVAAIACMLPLPVALATPPALIESLESTTRTLASPGFDLPLPWSHIAPPSDEQAAQKVEAAEELTMATEVVEVPASKNRVTAASLDDDLGIPEPALRAYREAAATLNRMDPSCGIDWALLAGIGRVESDHGRYGGATVAEDGSTSPQIVGLPLNGAPGVAAISDSDGGDLDGDTTWDRAVGPMQFIPTTWAQVAADGDGDGVRDPHDIDDAALAAGVYLCAGGGDLSTQSGAEAAVFRYNHSDEYVRLVLSLAENYRDGVEALPSTEPRGNGTAPTLDKVPDTNVNGEPVRTSKDDAEGQEKTDRRPTAPQPSKPKGGGGKNGGNDGNHDGTGFNNNGGKDGTGGDDSTGEGANDGTDNDTGNDTGGDAGNDTGGDDGSDTGGDDGNDTGGDDGGGTGGGTGGTGGGDDTNDEPETVTVSGSLSACGDLLCVTEDGGRIWTLDFAEVASQQDDGDYDEDDNETETIEKAFEGLSEKQNPTVTVEAEEREPDVATLLKVVKTDFDEPEQEPDPEPEPESEQIDGTVSSEDGTWFVTETGAASPSWKLELDDEQTAAGDYDGDGGDPEKLADELEGKPHQDVELTLVGRPQDDETVAIDTINGHRVTAVTAVPYEAS